MSMKIIYTAIDEAPAPAMCSLLPIIKVFTGAAGIDGCLNKGRNTELFAACAGLKTEA